MNEFYKLTGTVTIPEDKKKELNDNILKLLDRCGLRKIKKIIVAGSKVEVTCKVSPDSKGIVTFDYSVFEKKHRKKSYYNTNTCELKINDCGFSEFGITMMLVFTMLESYSITPCYTIKDGEIIDICLCAFLIEDILGIRLRFPHRADIWETYLFWRNNPDIHSMDIREIWKKVPWGFEETDLNMVFDIWNVYDNTFLSRNFEIVTFNKEQIAGAKDVERIKFLYSTYMELYDYNIKPEDYLQAIICKTLDERDKISKEDSEFAVIAELSKYLTAATMIHVYSLTVGEEFEKTWDRIAENGYYKDVVPDEKVVKKKTTDKKRAHYFFYKIIRRKSEDEFLGEDSNRELVISPDMKEELAKWKNHVKEITESFEIDILGEMLNILDEMNEILKVRKPDLELIKEIINIKKRENAIRILSLLRTILDEGTEYFPELTGEQAKRWILGRARSDFDTRKLDGLLGLLANKSKRMDILGF